MSETKYFSSPGETREFIDRWLASGILLHGSTTPNLAVLEPRAADDLHIHTPTGKVISPEEAISATNVRDVAGFYATAHKPVRLAGASRAAAVRPVRSPKKEIIEYDYFLSRRGKQIAKAAVGVIYGIEPRRLTLDPSGAEWRAWDLTPVVGSVLVCHEVLSFDVSALAAPNDDPIIRGFYEQNNWPPETPPLYSAGNTG